MQFSILIYPLLQPQNIESLSECFGTLFLFPHSFSYSPFPFGWWKFIVQTMLSPLIVFRESTQNRKRSDATTTTGKHSKIFNTSHTTISNVIIIIIGIGVVRKKKGNNNNNNNKRSHPFIIKPFSCEIFFHISSSFVFLTNNWRYVMFFFFISHFM